VWLAASDRFEPVDRPRGWLGSLDRSIDREGVPARPALRQQQDTRARCQKQGRRQGSKNGEASAILCPPWVVVGGGCGMLGGGRQRACFLSWDAPNWRCVKARRTARQHNATAASNVGRPMGRRRVAIGLSTQQSRRRRPFALEGAGCALGAQDTGRLACLASPLRAAPVGAALPTA
jgi:hypothetical protein